MNDVDFAISAIAWSWGLDSHLVTIPTYVVMSDVSYGMLTYIFGDMGYNYRWELKLETHKSKAYYGV